MKTDNMTGAVIDRPADLESVFDQEEALERIEGDSELLYELISLFLESHSEQVALIRAGLVRGDSEAVQRAAHALKGAVGNFVSRGAFEAAQRLEETARRGDLVGAGPVFTELEEALGHLTCALAVFCRGRVGDR